MMARLSIVAAKKRKCMNRCLIPTVDKQSVADTAQYMQLFMPDADAEYVWIIPFRVDAACRTIIAPYPFRPFRIENCCGSVTGLFDTDFREIARTMAAVYGGVVTGGKKTRKRSKRTCTVVSMLGGTITLCPERYQIDFRGARSIRLLKDDLEGIIGAPVASVGSYMMVLKGCLGMPVVTTSEDCYIARRMSTWCDGVKWHNDVGEMIELSGIRWASLFNQPPALGKSSACITRRGGVMLRVIFPPKTVWSPEMEADVNAGAARLMEKLVVAASGKLIGV
jgi:hypothetical protein